MFKNREKGHHRVALTKPQMSSPCELENFLQTTPDDKTCVLYIHVPYCDNICSFCNLNRTKLSGELEMYANYLVERIKYYANFPYARSKVFESVYFGGGTPTIFNQNQLERILKAINENFNISKNAEFSFESTLHNLNSSKIAIMQDLGVNRYSIGIQTFCDEGRKILNRVGDKNFALKRLSDIKREFKGFVCADIIYNYPGQSVCDVCEDAKILKNLNIDSCSFYSLQFMENSAFSKEYNQNYYDLNTDISLHHAFLDEMMSSGEYELLEYTKVSRKNRDEYRYIRLSHEGVDILPIGIGAGGKIGNFGIFSPNPKMTIVTKKSDWELKHMIFSDLFQYDKITLQSIKSFLDDETYAKELEFLKKCEKLGYVKIENECLNFSKDGIFWGNTIAINVIEIAKDYFLAKIAEER